MNYRCLLARMSVIVVLDNKCWTDLRNDGQGMITALVWIVVYLVAATVGEFVCEVTDTVNKDRELKPAAVGWFGLLGFGSGVASAAAVSFRLLPPAPFPGLSIIATPVLLGAFMWWFGAVKKGHTSHLATWYGGAALGLGLAAGRLAGLAFVASVRSI